VKKIAYKGRDSQGNTWKVPCRFRPGKEDIIVFVLKLGEDSGIIPVFARLARDDPKNPKKKWYYCQDLDLGLTLGKDAFLTLEEAKVGARTLMVARVTALLKRLQNPEWPPVKSYKLRPARSCFGMWVGG